MNLVLWNKLAERPAHQRPGGILPAFQGPVASGMAASWQASITMASSYACDRSFGGSFGSRMPSLPATQPVVLRDTRVNAKQEGSP